MTLWWIEKVDYPRLKQAKLVQSNDIQRNIVLDYLKEHSITAPVVERCSR